MIEIYLLEQLAAFADVGTLSGAAEKLHLTQPTVTRSMKKLEEETGVPLFIRSGRKIALNENGKAAAEYARRILKEESDMLRELHLMEQSQHRISLGAVGPGSILEIMPLISSLYPNYAINSEIKQESDLLSGLRDGTYHLIILTHMIENDSSLTSCVCGSERLYYCFDQTAHPTASDGVMFADINGRSILTPEDTGFWDNVIRKNLPDSHFLMQADNDSLNEVAENSSLPAFATDIGLRLSSRPGRVAVPILDDDACVTYHCFCLKKNRQKFLRLFNRLEKAAAQ